MLTTGAGWLSLRATSRIPKVRLPWSSFDGMGVEHESKRAAAAGESLAVAAHFSCLDVEAEFDDVTRLHDVLFALGAHLAGTLGGGL